MASLSGLKAAVDTIQQVDRQMTSLKRVMNEDTNFDKLLMGSIQLSKDLGRSITEVNEVLTEFARQGYDETQVLSITEAATLAQNISELNTDDAMNAITAAMVAFGIEANHSLSIVDKITEINISVSLHSNVY